MTYEQFIKQPNWEDTIYHNYCTNQPPLTASDPTFSTINNDTDYFIGGRGPIIYLKQLPEPARGHLTKALILKTKNPWYAYMYACDVIKGRWPEAEGIIKQYPWYAYVYALMVIKGRWPEAEGTIKTHQHWCAKYTEAFNIV